MRSPEPELPPASTGGRLRFQDRSHHPFAPEHLCFPAALKGAREGTLLGLHRMLLQFLVQQPVVLVRVLLACGIEVASELCSRGGQQEGDEARVLVGCRGRVAARGCFSEHLAEPLLGKRLDGNLDLSGGSGPGRVRRKGSEHKRGVRVSVERRGGSEVGQLGRSGGTDRQQASS